MTSGVDFIIETLGMRYEYDEQGRILRTRIGVYLSGFPPDLQSESLAGSQPLFVLGRAEEGCVWRFSASLANDRVIVVARLAAREPGFLIQTGTASPQPERLVMIERLLVPDLAGSGTRHEILMRDGSPVAELWTIAGSALALSGAVDP
jgi:hypothetical protein